MNRYRPYSEFLKTHFGAKVYKVALDAGFTCPNRDGTVARGGCTFCAEGSRAEYVNPALSLTGQLQAGMEKYRKKFGAQKFIAYFQAYTNTHGPIDRLRTVLCEPLRHPDVVGISVGTRPDCVPDDVLELLREISSQQYLLLEMGIQSLDNAVLQWINRGHDVKTFLDAAARAKAKGLRVCAHVILGFPGETVDSVIRMGRALSESGIDGIKIHNLHVIRQTPLAKTYLEGGVPMISKAQYFDLDSPAYGRGVGLRDARPRLGSGQNRIIEGHSKRIGRKRQLPGQDASSFFVSVFVDEVRQLHPGFFVHLAEDDAQMIQPALLDFPLPHHLAQDADVVVGDFLLQGKF